MTIRAIYEDGVFRPDEPVNFPNRSTVELDARIIQEDAATVEAREERARREISEILSRRYDTGQTDTAARHNEHQPGCVTH